jgi:hypothetical protein
LTIDLTCATKDAEGKMESDKLLRELASLPPEGRRQVARLVASLKKRYAHTTMRRKRKLRPLRQEQFIGMWKDREDLKDSSAWVRGVRKNEWMN